MFATGGKQPGKLANYRPGLSDLGDQMRFPETEPAQALTAS
jgi:hypothetical protein